MRRPVDEERIRAFMRELGLRARTPVSIYLTGGATAVLHGWRPSTIDIDLRVEPEADDLLRLLPELKERLQINVELASPIDFVPAPGWEGRSLFIESRGPVTFLHFDPYAQALSKIERGHTKDVQDVRDLIEHGLVEKAELLRVFELAEPLLFRYPAVDPASLRRGVLEVVRGTT